MGENPATKDAMRRRAEDLLRAGRSEEALDLYRELVCRAPESESLRMALAWACHDSGRTTEAMARFEELLDMEIGRSVFTGFAFDELVRIYRSLGLHDRLVRMCARVAAAQPEDPLLLAELAEAHLLAGEPGQAVAVCERVAALDPEGAEGYCRLGRALIAAGESGRAEAMFRRATECEPAREALFLERMAVAYAGCGRLPEAERTFRQCRSLAPLDVHLSAGLGDILLRQGRVAEAWEAFETAARLDPGAAGAWWNRLGCALGREGRSSWAIRAFRRAVDAEPGNPLYVRRLSEALNAGEQTAGSPAEAPAPE